MTKSSTDQRQSVASSTILIILSTLVLFGVSLMSGIYVGHQITNSKQINGHTDQRPEIISVLPTSGSEVISDKLLLTGAITPNNRLKVNGQQIETGDNGSFIADVTLQPGLNEIEFLIISPQGYTVKEIYKITYTNQTQAVNTSCSGKTSKYVLCELNKSRSEVGVAPLDQDSTLTQMVKDFLLQTDPVSLDINSKLDEQCKLDHRCDYSIIINISEKDSEQIIAELQANESFSNRYKESTKIGISDSNTSLVIILKD